MDFSALLGGLGEGGGGGGLGGLPNLSPGMMEKMMKGMQSVISPELLEIGNQPALVELRETPAQVFWPAAVQNSAEWRAWPALYPEYFERGLSRRGGRRVSQELASPGVDAAALMAALRSLDFPHVFENKRYARQVHAKGGRVRVHFQGSKTELLTAVAVALLAASPQPTPQNF